MNPALFDLIWSLLMIAMGILLGWMLFDTKDTRRKRTLLFVAAVSGLGVFAIGTQYLKTKQETCLISEAWVRFYNTPEMCSFAVIDRLTAESETNGEPEVWTQEDKDAVNELIESEKDLPMAIDVQTTEDGFDGDPPVT